MPKLSPALRQWLQLRQLLSPAPVLPNSGAKFLASSPALPSANGIVVVTRPFHTTPLRHANANSKAKPAPAAKRKREQALNSAPYYADQRTPGQYINREGIVFNSVAGNVDEVLGRFQKESGYIYDAARKDRSLSREISYKTFRDVGSKLIKAAYKSLPSAAAVRAISVDVDAVWRIGLLCSINRPLYGWIVTACAMAKAAMPTVIAASRAISEARVPGRTDMLNEVEKLAREGFPPAMVLHAKVLGMRGKRKEAIELLEQKVLPHVRPTRRKPSPHTDTTAGDSVPSPYRLYAFLQASEAELTGSEARGWESAIRTAASEYNDPEALVELASLMMSENNLTLYEDNMSKAAAAGNPKACLFLANFYYLIFHGKYPTREETARHAKNPNLAPRLESKKGPEEGKRELTNFVDDCIDFMHSYWRRVFKGTLKQSDYRQLARDWYYLAYVHGEKRAAFMVALLSREEGNEFDGTYFLAQAEIERDRDYAKQMNALKANWYNKDFEPTLPKRMLDVR
ncbi:uncharacterized protein N7459_003979 [Penicillium hispanicum]|uniref:uncharacterized protein n=1 Tax=Penicillium hispanicum TaxID=1080232 RepID=UPI002540A322|nr:uncharacterized protein N7459_003979 [Penicillium hispanicum]KAJ5584179.1 hypothetical protein N7459_003979 [Penicillium hispanicum]